MAAKEVSVFLPTGIEHLDVLRQVVEKLSLDVDRVPPGSPYAFSAQRRREDEGYILIEYDPNAEDVIQELGEWERPSVEYKQALGRCVASVIVHYRDSSDLRRCLLAIAESIGERASECVIENGLGVLILLSVACERMTDEASWSIEREQFPELSGVASSEWID